MHILLETQHIRENILVWSYSALLIKALAASMF